MHRSRLQRASKQAAWEHTPKHCCTQIKARYALLIFYVINSCLPVISCSTMFTHNKQSCSEPNLIQCLIWNANKLWGRGYHLNLFPFCSLAVILHEPMLQLCTVAKGRKRESVGGGGRRRRGERRGNTGGMLRRMGDVGERRWPQCDSEGCFLSHRCRARIYRKEGGKKEINRKEKRNKSCWYIKGIWNKKGDVSWK